MAGLLFGMFVLCEIGFAVFLCVSAPVKKVWSGKRLIVNGMELAVYLLLLLLPGVDGGFRFKALILLLVIRLILAAIRALLQRRDLGVKKKSGIILSAVIGIFFFALAMIPAFLFRDYKGRPTNGQYEVATCGAILVDFARAETFETDGSNREVPMHFYYPKEIEQIEKNSLPLVLFSHGAFGYYQSNVSTYMELASHGYVVVSLDHPYHSFFTKNTAGETITVNPEFIQDVMRVSETDTYSNEETYRLSKAWIALRTEDICFVLDSIKEAVSTGQTDEKWFFENDTNDNHVKNKVQAVLEGTDTSKIGLMGHSLGGAASVTAGRQREDISAVADLDGTMLGEYIGVESGVYLVNEEPYPVPLFSIDNEAHHFERIAEKEAGYVYANNVVLERAETGFETYFQGAGHMNYTDLPFIAPGLAKMLGIGEIDCEYCMDTVNRLLLQFFDCYLKGQGTFAVQEVY